jgi:hypothetical protein
MAIKLGNLILKEYSDKVVKALVERYKKQNPNLDEQTIRYYIARFDQLKGSIKKRFEKDDPVIIQALPKELKEKNFYLDITKYKFWKDLEKIIDIFPAPPSSLKASTTQNDDNDAETNADKIYEKDGLEVYRGDAQHKCVKYGNQMGNSYSWCISRADPSNMYSSYRFMRQDSRMFYFVFDRTRSSSGKKGEFNDIYHVIVIHVYEDGRYGFSHANNSGDKTAKNWDELGSFMPKELWNKIKPLKSLFKYVSPSQDEKEMAALQGKVLSLDQFKDLSYNTKLQYINAGNKLSEEQISVLDTELKNQYINIGHPIPFEAIKNNVPLMKRYITIQFVRKDKPVNADYLEYMDDEMKKEYFKKYKDEPCLSFDAMLKYFPEELPNYINDFIDNLIYLPENYKKYMTPEQINIYNMYIPAYNNTQITSMEDKESYLVNYFLTPYRMLFYNTPNDKKGNVKIPIFSELPPQIKKLFVNFIKNLVKNNDLNQYSLFLQTIPEYDIKSGELYLNTNPNEKDPKQWTSENSLLNESIYDDWNKYSFQLKSGILK